MVDAQVAFTAPERMRVGQTLAVQAILAPGMDADLANRLIGLLTAQGRREVAQLRASDRMRATLTGGAAFEVTPSGPQMQFVGSNEPTTWHWEAAAKLAGKHELTLSFEAIISVNGVEGQRRIRTLTRTIEVEDGWPETLSEWLTLLKEMAEKASYLWLTVLVPIGVFVGSRWRRWQRTEGVAGTSGAATAGTRNSVDTVPASAPTTPHADVKAGQAPP
jgi:hypothetical protein